MCQANKCNAIFIRNLSSSELTGEIAPSIASLTMIQILYEPASFYIRFFFSSFVKSINTHRIFKFRELSNNNFTGRVPKFLSQLQQLRVLWVFLFVLVIFILLPIKPSLWIWWPSVINWQKLGEQPAQRYTSSRAHGKMEEIFATTEVSYYYNYYYFF